MSVPPATVHTMTKGFTATGNGWRVDWRPPDELSGDPFLVSVIDADLRAAPDDVIAFSPVGPFVSATRSEPLAVLAVLSRILPGEFELSGDLSFYPSVPDGAVS